MTEYLKVYLLVEISVHMTHHLFHLSVESSLHNIYLFQPQYPTQENKCISITPQQNYNNMNPTIHHCLSRLEIPAIASPIATCHKQEVQS